MKTIKLKPHHFMCIHGFQGNGYSQPFVENFYSVIEELKKPDATVEMTESLDEICGPCPNNLSTKCSSQEKITELDSAYKKTLNLHHGQKMKWEEAKKIVAQKVSFKDFEKNCSPCSWKKMGFCQTALKNLKAQMLLFIVFFSISVFSTNIQAQEPQGALTEAEKSQLIKELLDQKNSNESASPTKSISIEIIEQNIALDHSKRVPTFAKISDAWKKQDYKKIIELLKEIKSQKQFADFYHFLYAQAEHARTLDFFRKGKLQQALTSGESALLHAKQVPLVNPYTSLEKHASVLQGETEVIMADIYLKKKNTAAAYEKFEEGFQRLSSENLLVLVPKKTILDYALLCKRSKKTKQELCMNWVNKLSPILSRTEEGKIVEKILQFKKTIIERPSVQSPYKVDVDLLAFQKGYDQYREGKFEAAFATWQDLLKDYPRTTIKLRTTFWMARAAQKAGYDAQAETLYRMVIHDLPFSYYALLASWYSGIDLSRMMDLELPNAVTEADGIPPADLVHVKRAETFIASGTPEYAFYELQEISSISNLPTEFLVYLASLNHFAGNHLNAFKIFGELSNRNFFGHYSSYGQKILFPTTHLPLIRDIAKDFSVDPLLVISVIKQESAFKKDAVSSSNAFGLMQIIIPTARDLDSRVEVTDLFAPTFNIKLGSKYISKLMNKYKGDIISTLAAYNAGPGNSDRWLREAPENLPPEEYIEMIGFRETREYVQNILRNLYWYNRRLKGDAAPNLRSLINFISPNTGPANRDPQKISTSHRIRRRVPATNGSKNR